MKEKKRFISLRLQSFVKNPGALRVTLALLWGIFASVAGAAVPAGPVTLSGHVPAAVSHLTPVSRLVATNRLHLAIGLPLRNKAGMNALFQNIYNPASPSYRHYLQPAEFTALFGPTEQDYQKVVDFAQANGLTVTATPANRLLLEVSGQASDVERAFNVTLHTYHHPTENRDFFAPDIEPTVAASLPIVQVGGLNNYFRPHPQLRFQTAGGSSPVPMAGSGPGGNYLGNDFRNAYAPGTALNGSGQKVALVQFDGYAASDITQYNVLAGIPSVPLTNILLNGFSGIPTGSGGEVEVSLDIEMVNSMAPGLSQILVYEGDPYNFIPDVVLNQIAVDNAAQQVSCSWGWGGGADIVADTIFQEMAFQGQSFYNASGDSDAFLAGQVDDPNQAGFPSASPYIMQVGGTTLTTSGGAWSSEKVWNWGLTDPINYDGVGSCGGISSHYSIPVYQQGISMAGNQGSATGRNIPDVAMTGDNVYVIADNGTPYPGTGGTSCAAPLWAGFTALVNQQAALDALPSVGFANTALYAIANGTNYNACFHDTTNGNNTWSQSPAQFYAVPGYDLCTGLGTPTGTNLINALALTGGGNFMGPGNDNFINAAVISGVSGTTNAISIGATLEGCEPVSVLTGDYGIETVSKSIWYQWTAPVNGSVSFDTVGSTFDTILAVYTTPSDLCDTNLTLVAANDDTANVADLVSPAFPSQLSFTATAGTTYYISVDGNPNSLPGDDSGGVVLNWQIAGFGTTPSIPSGTFAFTTTTYSVGDNESDAVTAPTPSPRSATVFPSLSGARVTVTRSGGASGRVNVPITVVGDASQAAATVAGTLVFDDYQMSASFVLPISANPDTNGLPATINCTLGTPTLDPLEYDSTGSTDLLPPTGAGSTEAISVLSTTKWPSSNTNSLLNLERATFRVDRDWIQNHGGNAVIYVTRGGGAGGQAVTVDYVINASSHGKRSGNGGNGPANSYALEASSDYAVANSDFTPVSGTLSWGANDGNAKPISIPILTNGLNFNLDLQVQIYIPNGSTEPAVVGAVNAATLTIIADSFVDGIQPAGAADQTWNQDNWNNSNSSEAPSQSDPTYPGTGGGVVQASVIQPNGKCIIAGSFISYNSVTYNRIVRLLTNGVQDPTFLASPNSGANDTIYAMALQPDGKIIIGGNFTSFNGANRYHIARLNSNGSVDTNFKPGIGVNGPVYALALQANGQIVIGGNFTSVNGTNMNCVARLNTDGSLDTSFNPGVGPTIFVDGDFIPGTVNALVVDSSGRVVIGGDFDGVSGGDNGGIARLNLDGSLDNTFSSGIGTYNPDSGITEPVYVLALEGNQILVGGSFAYMELASYNGLVRLNSDGTIDTTFNPGTGTYNPQTGLVDAIYAITLQPDGAILVGGDFTTFNQTRRMGLARLFNYGSVDTSFMDTAYNQFAGLINHYHNPNAVNTNDVPASNYRNFVNTIAVELTSPNNVIIGGSFYRVGGGSVYHSGLYPMSPGFSGVFDNARMDILPRVNVARLVGGATPGPGNITLTRDSYSANKNGGPLYVNLTRTNGSLGSVSALCLPQYKTPGPGIATASDFSGGANPYWLTIYLYVSPLASWPTAPGTFGPNELYDGTYGYNQQLPNPDVRFTINNDTNTVGNLNGEIALSAPDGSSFTLGGESIPLGTALGSRNLTPLTIIDTNIKPGVFGFSSPTYTVSQGSAATITITRTNGTDGPVDINYTAYNGSATSPANYTAVSGTKHFGPGVTSQTFLVPTTTSTTTQPDKTVNLLLSSVSAGATIGQANAVLTIVNNNFTSGHVYFTSTNYLANENSGNALVTVNRLGGSSGTLDVTAVIGGGTAVNGVNYIGPVGSTNQLHWNNSDISVKTISIPLIHDGVFTPNLTLNLRLTNGMANTKLNGNVLANSGYYSITNATLTLANVDLPGTVEFTTGIYAVKKYAGYALIPVIRTGGYAQTVTVNFATLDGSATNGVNYTATNGLLTFTNGEVAKYIKVNIIDDGQTDGLLALNLVLSNATPGISLGSPNTAVLNIIDTASVNEPPGSGDTTYSSFAGFNGNVYTLALQPNNQLLAGGDFTMADGVPRQRLARLNANGSLDAGFLLPSSAMGADAQIQALAVQTDGRIVVGGFFSNFNSVVESRITRLNYDGSLDSTFNIGSGADNPVYALAQSPLDSKILVGGAFATISGVTFNGVGRLNSDGTPDNGFNTGGLGANATVYALTIQTDGKIIIGGDFTAYNGVPVNRLARLNTDGSLDTSFNVGTAASASVRAVTIQLDGKILIGGSFTNYNGVLLNCVARLNTDGSVDSGFTPGVGANDMVTSIATQTDGRIVLGGQFTRCNGVTRNRLTRLNPDGTVDPTINFGSGASDLVSAVVIQEDSIVGYPTNVPDEKIIIGGTFTQYNSQPHDHLARIYGGSISGSGAFEFSAATYQVDETGPYAVVTVNRTGGTSGTNADGSGDVLVPFATSDGGAKAGLNYIGVTNNLDFPVGEVQAFIVIPVMDDHVITTNLDVNLTLTPTQLSEYGNQLTSTLWIINDDSVVNFSTATYQIPKNVVNGLAPINIVRLGSSSGTASVIFNTTTNGTAVAGTDYNPVTNALVTFNPGVTNVVMAVPIINNALPEGARTVTMQLNNVTNCTLSSPSNSVLTIIDTVNAPGTLSFAATNIVVSSGGVDAYITVIRTNGSTGIISASYTTVPGTALPGFDYLTTSNTITFGNGVTTGTIVIPLIDNSVVQGPVNFGVVLSNPLNGASLAAPTNMVVTIISDKSGIIFAMATNTVPENSGSVAISVLRIGNTNAVISANYTTVNGSAQAGVNYTTVSGTLTFTNGELLKSIIVPLINDPQVTGDLNFTVNLSNPSIGTQLGTPPMTTVVVQDADAGLSFTNATMTVLKNAGLATVTVVCSNPRVEPVVLTTNDIPLRVNYATADGNALAGVNYQAVSGTLVFTNGIGTNTFTVPIIYNGLVTGDKAFTVALSNPTAPGQLVAPSTQTITIAESNPGLRFSQSSYSVFKNGVTAAITVNRVGNTDSVATVNYLATNGTAISGVNFVPTSGTLAFTNGVTSQTFNVSIINNNAVQPNLNVLLELSNPGNGVLLSPSAATLTIIDNSGSYVIPAGAQLVSESGPVNGLIDSNETVQVLFAFRDAAGLNVTNLFARLLSGNGVVSPVPATNQNYGPLTAFGHSVSRAFTFTAQGTNAGTITPTFALYDTTTPIGTNAFTFTLGSWARSFSNSAAITINDTNAASPYPSVINVNGVGGSIVKATVTLNKLTHTWPHDVGALVVSPAQLNTLIMSHVGAQAVANAMLTFDDAATNVLTPASVITTSTNKVSNNNYPVNPVLDFP